MTVLRTGKCALAVSFTGLLVALLWLAIGAPPAMAQTATAQTATATPSPATTGLTATVPSTPALGSTGDGQFLGRLTFGANGQAAAGDFQLTLTGLPAAPDGSSYYLWLADATTGTLPLGPFSVTAGQVAFSGSTSEDLPARYPIAYITLGAAAVDEPDPAAPVVISATFPATVATALHPLLQLAAAPPMTTADGALVGALTAAQGQVAIAVQHTGFLRDALITDDIPQARQHSEHIINVLDGKNGFMYSDLDRNGRVENPGDGVGVRVYLQAIAQATDSLSATLGSTAAISLSQLLTDVAQSQTAIEAIFDKALQIFAADTLTEANGFAADLTTQVDQLSAQVNAAHARTLQVVAYPFVGPVQLPVASTSAVTVTAPATRLQSPTARPQRTLVATRTPTSGAAHAHLHTAPITATITVTVAPTQRPTPTPRPSSTATPTATPAPTLAPLPTVQSSLLSDPVAGQRWQDPTDGGVYIYVPGGSFLMGSTADEAVSPREAPQHEVAVAGFWLGQSEVTNAQYGRCVAAEECTPPANEQWDDPTYAEHPVSHVSWTQANGYAAWAGGRLPTEAEWERTCRGDDGRTYPWGNEEPDATRSNYNNSTGATTPVGSYPAGQSAYGHLDLSGNLWEWTSSLETDYPYAADDGREEADGDGQRAVRGGSFYYTSYQIRCAARTGFAPTESSEHIGFRLVLDAPTVAYRNAQDGGVYVYVPGGRFLMGSLAAEAVSPREAPQHEVAVAGFWLGQSEVTNAQYGRCVAAGACTVPANEQWDDPAYAEHPVSHVSWTQANAYAAWVGGRLPTEAEWERTCRGDDGRTYPWGNEEPDATRSNYNNSIGATTPVGSYPAGQSAYGHLDLSGNLWEWTSSLETDYPYAADDGREEADGDGLRAVRGGSFYYTSYQIRCAARTGFAPPTANEHIGFRLVLDLPLQVGE